MRMIYSELQTSAGFVSTPIAKAPGLELAEAPKAALLFYWKACTVRFRVRGPIEPVSDAEADAYFATRSRESRIGAWASQQSRRSTAAELSMKRWQSGLPNSQARTCRAPSLAWLPVYRSNRISGTTGRTGCMTASCSGALPQCAMGQDAALSVVGARAYFAQMAQIPNEERKTLILTGASRGMPR